MNNAEIFKLVTKKSDGEFKTALENKLLSPDATTYHPDLAPPNELTPLIVVASKWNQSNKVRLLVNLNVSVNLCDSDNKTPLLFASYFNDVDLIHFLIANGADINTCFKWYLDHYQSQNQFDNVFAAQALLNLSACINSYDPSTKSIIINQLFTKQIIKTPADFSALCFATNDCIRLTEDHILTSLHILTLSTHSVGLNQHYIRQINRVIAHIKKREFVKAKQAAKEALQIYPDGAWAHYYLGVLYKNGQPAPIQYLKAVKSFLKAIKHADEIKDECIKLLSIAQLDKIALLPGHAFSDEVAVKLVRFYIENGHIQKGINLLQKRTILNYELTELKNHCDTLLKSNSPAHLSDDDEVKSSSSSSTADTSSAATGTKIGFGQASSNPTLFAPSLVSATNTSTKEKLASSKRTLPSTENYTVDQLKIFKQRFPGVQVAAAEGARKRRMSI